MKKLLIILLLISLALLITNCKKKTTEPPDPNATILASNTKVLTQEQANTITAAPSSEVTFAGTAVTSGSFAAGDIIVSTPATLIPDGLLRKVVSVTAQGNQVTLTTTAVKLEAVFRQTDFTWSQNLRKSALRQTRLLTDGITFIQDDKDPERFSYSIDKNIPLGNNINLVAYGLVSFTHSFDLGMHITTGQGTTRFSFDYQSDQSNNLVLSTNGAFSYAQEIALAEQEFNPLVKMVGTVPIVIVPKVTVSLKIDGNGFASFTANVTNTANVTTGLAYQNAAWTANHEKTIGYTYQSPQLSNNMDLDGGCGAQTDFLFYGQAGPWMRYAAVNNLSANLANVPWWVLTGNYTADAGVDFAVISALANHTETGIITNSQVIVQAAENIVADPVFNPGEGAYNNQQSVSISCPTSGATIRYTTDGSDPTSSSTQYTAPLLFTTTTTLNVKYRSWDLSCPMASFSVEATIMPFSSSILVISISGSVGSFSSLR